MQTDRELLNPLTLIVQYSGDHENKRTKHEEQCTKEKYITL